MTLHLNDSATAQKLLDKVNETQEEASEAFALEVGLRYVHDNEPGIKRVRRGKSFTYLNAKGTRVTDVKTLERIQSLVIPPAWEDVWICPHPKGHLQATGRDVRRRKQYRYHPEWSLKRNENKFEHLLTFGKTLPAIRRQTENALKQPGLTREKVLAATVQIMELTKIRIGNDVYAQENDSYGLTTMLQTHTELHGATVKFKFKGKSGIQHEVTFSDPRLSRVIRRCQDLPGEELFGYEDENGQPHRISSSDVNEYLRQISGASISAKDFRTWGGTLKALEVLISEGPAETTTQVAQKKRMLATIREVAEHLRNTVAVCRKYYVHPMVFELDSSGRLHEIAHAPAKKRVHGLTRQENLLLQLLGTSALQAAAGKPNKSSKPARRSPPRRTRSLRAV